MKKLFWMLLLLVIVLAACSRGDTALECSQGVCMDVKIEEPVEALKPATFMITVRSDKNLDRVSVSMVTDPGVTVKKAKDTPEGAEVNDQDNRSISWSLLDVKGREEYTFSGIIVIDKPRGSLGVFHYGIVANVYVPPENRMSKSYTVHLDPDGKHVDKKKAKILEETPCLLPTDATPYFTITPEPKNKKPEKPIEPTLTPSPSAPAYPYPAPDEGEKESSAPEVTIQGELSATPAAYPEP